MFAGTFGCVAALSKLHAVTHAYSWSGSSRFAWSIAYVLLLLLAAYGFGLPEQPRTRRGAAWSAVGATFTAALAVSLAQLVVGDALLPRFVVLGSAVVLVPWFMLCAALAGDGRARADARDRVVAVAEPDEVADLDRELQRAPERNGTVVASLTVGAATSTSVPPTRPLLAAARDAKATVVVLNRVAQAEDDVVEQAAILHEEGVRVRTMSLFYEQWLGKLPIADLERVSLLFDIGEVHAPGYARVKRLLDVALALCGCVALVVVFPVVAVGDLVANRGRLLFRQRRVGRHGAEFEMLKFRTMRVPDPGEQGRAGWAPDDDARITRFGRVLRRTHLDELPQVLNVLRGELSVVGPRPEQPQLVAQLEGKIPYYRIRHLVRPGLTGWAQVKYPYAASEAETLQKLQYEVYYLRRQSLGLDARIVARTVRTVVGRQGR
jgi:exopolysaccharide biosynthesis polyprenyl glycosylphosphotransferase